MSSRFLNTANSPSSISCAEMDGLALDKQKNPQFIASFGENETVSKAVGQNYLMVDFKNQKLMNFENLYFVTFEIRFYRDHHSGKIIRKKARMGPNVDSSLHFLERKSEGGRNNTSKKSTQLPGDENISSRHKQGLINMPTECEYVLQGTISNNFQRMTFEKVSEEEKVTLDLNLTFKTPIREKGLHKLEVLKVKQGTQYRKSTIILASKANGIAPSVASKHCICVTSIHDNVKSNSYKLKLVKVKINNR